MMEKDPENTENYHDQMHEYLEGLIHSMSGSSAQADMRILQMIITLLRGFSKIDKAVKEKFHKQEKEFNNLLSRVVKLDKEFEDMKKGK